jgi:hypothetical protein
MHPSPAMFVRNRSVANNNNKNYYNIIVLAETLAVGRAGDHGDWST